MQQRKKYTVILEKYAFQHQKISITTIIKYVLQRWKHVLLHWKIFTITIKKICTAISKKRYYNISSSSATTMQKHMLQRPKNLIATFENHLFKHLKTPIATRGDNSNPELARTPSNPDLEKNHLYFIKAAVVFLVSDGAVSSVEHRVAWRS